MSFEEEHGIGSKKNKVAKKMGKRDRFSKAIGKIVDRNKNWETKDTL